jgi:quercetin dioxygenase-like cupin family protein
VNFEGVRSTLPPGCVAGTYSPYAAGSHEFIVVQSGTVTLTVDDRETILLGAGDSL